jgi:hypothetical protein
MKLIKPALRKLFTQAQAEELFDGKTASVKSRDQIAQRDESYHIARGSAANTPVDWHM